MAKNRMINTKFWSDPFVVDELNPLDRYLFLYLLTNEKTNSIGIYEISMRTLSFETGIDKDTLSKMLERLESKVLYINGWICFKNFVKHQSPNPNQQKGMERVWLEEVSASIKEKLIPFAKDFKGFIKDSLLNLTLLNLTKPNQTEKSETATRADIDSNEIEKLLKYWNDTFKLKNRLTDNLSELYKKTRKKYKKEDIELAVINYKKGMQEDTYNKHRFSLYDFLKQGNGLIKFLNK